MVSRGNKLKYILIDLSGTIHIEDTATHGAVEALKRLRQHPNVRLRFVTNTTKESRKILHSRLNKIGFEIDTNEIISSLWAARELLVRESLVPFLLVDDNAKEDFEGIPNPNDKDPSAVVVGLAPKKFNSKELNTAFRYLVDGAKLIAIHKSKYYMTKEGMSLGPGLFVKLLEHASGRESVVVGKPSEDFFKLALPSGSDPKDAVMIGDDAEQDIRGSQSLGMKGYLVKTGKYLEGDEHKINPPPYKTVGSFAEAVNDILINLN